MLGGELLVQVSDDVTEVHASERLTEYPAHRVYIAGVTPQRVMHSSERSDTSINTPVDGVDEVRGVPG